MSAEPRTASIEAALAHALRLLDVQPALAAEQAREILATAPGHPGAELLLGMAANAQSDFARAEAILDPLARGQPRSARRTYSLSLFLRTFRPTAFITQM